jgi:flagellar protein FliS
MLHRAHRSYQNLQAETTVAAASPAELVVMIYDRILEHIRDAVSLIEKGDGCEVSIQKALDLISEGLMAALDLERGGELAGNLAGLYEWSMRSLLRARLRRDSALLQDVSRVLDSLREAWLAAENKSA